MRDPVTDTAPDVLTRLAALLQDPDAFSRLAASLRAPADLSRALMVALLSEVARAYDMLDIALRIQQGQSALTPADAEAWLQNLIVVVANPAMAFWDALEPEQLRAAGTHFILAFVREIAAKSAGWHAVSRQFADPAARASESPSPAPGSGPQ